MKMIDDDIDDSYHRQNPIIANIRVIKQHAIEGNIEDNDTDYNGTEYNYTNDTNNTDKNYLIAKIGI